MGRLLSNATLALLRHRNHSRTCCPTEPFALIVGAHTQQQSSSPRFNYWCVNSLLDSIGHHSQYSSTARCGQLTRTWMECVFKRERCHSGALQQLDSKASCRALATRTTTSTTTPPPHVRACLWISSLHQVAGRRTRLPGRRVWPCILPCGRVVQVL